MQGNLRKLKGELSSVIQYSLPIGEQFIPLNELIGRDVSFEFLNVINCIHCGRKTNKSFQQGFCFPCYRRLAECDCALHPERCRVEKDGCPEDDWAHSHCHGDHIIYLANTSGLKVGITRASQVPTRWIDQGATQALPIMQVFNRYQSGLVEVALKNFVADKTNWRAMLKGSNNSLDLKTLKDELIDKASDFIQEAESKFSYGKIQYLNEDIVDISYPVSQYPDKIKSFNLDKNPVVQGKLLGVKGQYLIFDTGVINIRKFGGYLIRVDL